MCLRLCTVRVYIWTNSICINLLITCSEDKESNNRGRNLNHSCQFWLTCFSQGTCCGSEQYGYSKFTHALITHINILLYTHTQSMCTQCHGNLFERNMEIQVMDYLASVNIDKRRQIESNMLEKVCGVIIT